MNEHEDAPSPSGSPSKYITVIDIYDLAEAINHDFECLAKLHGNDLIQSLVRKVISALETLEALVKHNDNGNSEIANLLDTIQRLETDKKRRIYDKENLEKDIVEMEDNYKKEIDNLCIHLKNLKNENTNLKAKFSVNDPCKSELEKHDYDGDLQLIIELRQTSKKQKEQIKTLKQEASDFNLEVEGLRSSIELLFSQNKELLRKNKSLQKQGRILLLERRDLLKNLQASETRRLELQGLLNDANRDPCCGLNNSSNENEETRFTTTELREVLDEKNSLKAKVIELEELIQTNKLPNLARSETGSDIKDDSSAFSENSFSSIADDCVYGPINREPEDKLHPWIYQRKNSGIRRFFQLFFKDSTTS